MKVTQSCPILCYPMDYAVLGILQARLEWVAIPFSRSSQPSSPTLQADSLPAELPTRSHLKIVRVWWAYTDALSFQPHVNIFLFLKHLFIFCLHWVFLTAHKLSLVAASGDYFSCSAQASPCGDLSCCRAFALECGLSSCDTWTLLSISVYNPPVSGTEPMFPAFAGRFSIIGPPWETYWQRTFSSLFWG